MAVHKLSSLDFFQDPDLGIEVIKRNPQIPFPLHTHDFAELVIILSGTGIHFTRGASYQVHPGDVFLIEKGFAHGYKQPKDLILYNILFDPALLRQSFIDIRQMPGYHAIFHIEPKYRREHEFRHRLQLHKLQIDPICSLVESMRQELEEPKSGPSKETNASKGIGDKDLRDSRNRDSSDSSSRGGNRAMAFAYFIQLIVTLSRLYESSTHMDNLVISRLARVFTYMEQHVASAVSLEKLMDISGMSASTLNRAFKRATRFSPIEYHLRLRISHACRRLETSPRSITEIAYDLGFSDSNYFTRQFSKIVGIPPGIYRKNRKIPTS